MYMIFYGGNVYETLGALTRRVFFTICVAVVVCCLSGIFPITGNSRQIKNCLWPKVPVICSNPRIKQSGLTPIALWDIDHTDEYVEVEYSCKLSS